jgi:hypothetical protein
MVELICNYCKKQFVSTNKHRKYCSVNCSNESKIGRKMPKYEKIGNKDISYYIGKRFGRLEVIKQITSDKHCNRMVQCLCDCGNLTNVRVNNLRDRGGTNSCGCLQKEIAKKTFSKEKGIASFNALYARYKQNAGIRGLKFNLNKQQFRELTSKNCVYCGQPPSTVSHKQSHGKTYNGAYIYNGIDRIDSTVGYVIDNCIPCCTICNKMKMVLSKDDFLSQILKIYNQQKSIRYW